MVLDTVIHLAGLPGLEAGVTLLGQTYARAESVKVFRRQCRELSSRCVDILVTLNDSIEDLEGTRSAGIAYELQPIIERIHRKVNEWAEWGLLKSFLQQREIKDGIDRLNRDLDAAMNKFQIQINFEVNRAAGGLAALHERDSAEIRDLLLTIVQSNVEMKELLSMRNPLAVEEMMQGLQTQLHGQDLPSTEEKKFKEGLWMLHEKTSQLPPLTDLSGQITMSTELPVREGSSNNIYQGVWLDQEDVALRLPIALEGNAEVQERFEREVAIWRQLHNENVIPLLGIVHINGKLFSVTRWMDNGSALDYTRVNVAVDRPKLLTEIAAGLEYLHNNAIVHGDLRAANVLISKSGIALLSDFGVSKFLEDCSKSSNSPSMASLRWAAPETLGDKGVVSKFSDVWSFGMTCLEILTGEHPWMGLKDKEVSNELHSGKVGKHPKRPDSRIVTTRGLSAEMWDLMRKCWSTDPTERPTMTSIKKKLLEMRGLADIHRPNRGRISTLFSPSPRGDSKLSLPESIASRSSVGSVIESPRSPGGPSRFCSVIYDEPDHVNILSVNRQKSVTQKNNLSPIELKPPPSPTRSHISETYSPTRTKAQQIPSSSKRTIQDNNSNSVSSSLPNHLGIEFNDHWGTTIKNSQRMSFARSTHSADSTSDSLTSAEKAVRSPSRVVYPGTGEPSSGTLDGLIDYLIQNFSSRNHSEFLHAFMLACSEITTPDVLFERLSYRFEEIRTELVLFDDDRAAQQYNIVCIISDWLDDRNLPPSMELLSRVKAFCQREIQSTAFPAVANGALMLGKKCENHILQKRVSANSSRSLRGPILDSSDIKPRDLAIALTMVEGDNFAALQPVDYVRHLSGRSSINFAKACQVNNKIFTWVVDNILYYDEIDKRAKVLKMFIRTAIECRNLRNFSSSITIIVALHSAAVENLKLTRRALEPELKQKLNKLYEITDPESNHQRYREAINNVATPSERNSCIPWLAVHLKDLQKVIRENRSTTQVGDLHHINIQRYIKFLDRMKEVIHHSPPRMDEHRLSGKAAYLEKQLERIVCDKDTQNKLLERSNRLVKLEAIAYGNRSEELRVLRFRGFS